MALTKAEIAEALFNQLGLNKREARELVDLFFEDQHALFEVVHPHAIKSGIFELDLDTGKLHHLLLEIHG